MDQQSFAEMEYERGRYAIAGTDSGADSGNLGIVQPDIADAGHGAISAWSTRADQALNQALAAMPR